MSSIKISPIESKSSCSSVPLFSISEINSNIEKSGEKQITFEVKTNTFNRKIQVKTKQEDTICTTNKFSPIITCSTTSPKRVRVDQSPRSSSKFISKNKNKKNFLL